MTSAAATKRFISSLIALLATAAAIINFLPESMAFSSSHYYYYYYHHHHCHSPSNPLIIKPTTTTTTTTTTATFATILGVVSSCLSKEEALEEKVFRDGEKFLPVPSKRCFHENDIVLRNFTDKAPQQVQLQLQQQQQQDMMPDAPHLTFEKYLTMQEKRVVVSFRFTEVPYLRPYFLTFSSKLKQMHADIILEKQVVPLVEATAQPIFEVLVDGKVVIGGSGSSRERHILGGRVDVLDTQSVYVNMDQLGLAIAKARRKRRPSTVYGEDEDDTRRNKKLRSYVLRQSEQQME